MCLSISNDERMLYDRMWMQDLAVIDIALSRKLPSYLCIQFEKDWFSFRMLRLWLFFCNDFKWAIRGQPLLGDAHHQLATFKAVSRIKCQRCHSVFNQRLNCKLTSIHIITLMNSFLSSKSPKQMHYWCVSECLSTVSCDHMLSFSLPLFFSLWLPHTLE